MQLKTILNRVQKNSNILFTVVFAGSKRHRYQRLQLSSIHAETAAQSAQCAATEGLGTTG